MEPRPVMAYPYFTFNRLFAVLAMIAFIVAAAIAAPDWDTAHFWISVGLALFSAAHVF